MIEEISTIIADILECENLHINVEKSHRPKHKKFDILKDKIILFLEESTITFQHCKSNFTKSRIDSLHHFLMIVEKTSSSSKEEQHFDSMLEHEIKNILSNAKNSIELLKDYDFEEDDRKKLIYEVHRAVDEAVDIFEELLLLNKFDFEKKELLLSMEAFDIQSLIKEILDEAVYEIHQKSIQLVNITPPPKHLNSSD